MQPFTLRLLIPFTLVVLLLSSVATRLTTVRTRRSLRPQPPSPQPPLRLFWQPRSQSRALSVRVWENRLPLTMPRLWSGRAYAT